VRYGPQWLSVPPSLPAGAAQVRVIAWNIEGNAIPIADFLAALKSAEADLVGLAEVIPTYSAAIEADEELAALYPYRVLPARSGFRGMGLLSRFPITERDRSIDPPYVHARVDPEGGEPFGVVVGHPILGRASSIGLLPIDLNTQPRDRHIARIRSIVDGELAAGADVLLMGDFNVTEREPAYGEVSRGLWDAHAEVGQGPGFTWRHQRLKHLPFGILRIDYALGGGAFRPVASSVDCTPLGSDHCMVMATFVREAAAAR
jgi:vancomycin resistance protein VanJ